MTDLVPAAAFALDRLASEPESIPDALDRAARLDALARLLDRYRTVARDYLAARGAERVATDGAFNVPIKGTGRTYLDQPEGTFRIANRDVCAEWLSAVDPESVRTVYRPRWPDVPARDDPAELVSTMLDALAVATPDQLREAEIVLDEPRALALAAEGDYDPTSVSSVRYVEKDTGAVWATGIEYVPPRDPRLTVRIDKAYAATLDAELARLVG